MRKYIFTSVISLVIILTGIFITRPTFGQTIPGVEQWFVNITGNYLYPLRSGVAIRVPSLGSTGNPCVDIADINGTFATTPATDPV